MELVTLRDILFCIAGLLLIVTFKNQGKSILEERKKMNRAVGLHFKYNRGDVKVSQYLALLSGILLLILGLASLSDILHIS